MFFFFNLQLKLLKRTLCGWIDDRSLRLIACFCCHYFQKIVDSWSTWIPKAARKVRHWTGKFKQTCLLWRWLKRWSILKGKVYLSFFNSLMILILDINVDVHIKNNIWKLNFKSWLCFWDIAENREWICPKRKQNP